MKAMYQWKTNAKLRKYVFVYGVLALPLIFYVVFYLFPNLLSVVYSFFYWDGLTKPKFLGFKNYVYLFKDPFFYRALKNNLILCAVVPLISLGISIILAFAIARRRSRLHNFFQGLFFVPNVISSVVISLLWIFIYNGDFGLLNRILLLLGINTNGFWWLGNSKTALVAIIPVYVWVNVGFYTLIFANAIKTIPSSIYESALLDGATERTILWRIVVPLIMNIVRVSALFMVLATFKAYDLILILTGGGPAGATDVLGLYMFSMVFRIAGAGSRPPNYGYASTIGIFLFVILVLSNWLLNKFMPNENVEF